MPMRLVLLRTSCQMKGVFLGTPGGALASLTPMDIARTPAPLRTGRALRVSPGTSLCGQKHPAQCCTANVNPYTHAAEDGDGAPRQPRHVPLQKTGPPVNTANPCMQFEWHA